LEKTSGNNSRGLIGTQADDALLSRTSLMEQEQVLKNCLMEQEQVLKNKSYGTRTGAQELSRTLHMLHVMLKKLCLIFSVNMNVIKIFNVIFLISDRKKLFFM
jgi:hypothetical protein